MMIFQGLPFVFRAIMMNPGFVSSCDILEEIIFETISVNKFLIISFPLFMGSVNCLGAYLAQTFL